MARTMTRLEGLDDLHAAAAQCGQGWLTCSERVVSWQVPSWGGCCGALTWAAAAMSSRTRASFSARVPVPMASRP
jgi:hypothetical protein